MPTAATSGSNPRDHTEEDDLGVKLIIFNEN
jgi:hypothetical protein